MKTVFGKPMVGLPGLFCLCGSNPEERLGAENAPLRQVKLPGKSGVLAR